MKLILTLLILLVNKSLIVACGFYPYGDDIRFSILTPNLFSNQNYSNFFYSYSEFNSDGRVLELNKAKKMNLQLWSNRFKNRISLGDIDSVIYGNVRIEKKNVSKNEFIKALLETNDRVALNYLEFAKKCEAFNSSELTDPWERNLQNIEIVRNNLIKTAIDRLDTISDESIKLRYAFLVIRLSYYNNDKNKLNKVYDLYFSNRKTKNILDYWSLYCKSQIQESGAEANFSSAIVFYNAPDKQIMVLRKYDNQISINETLSFAKSKKEKAQVWLLDGIKTTGKALEHIKNIFEYDPSFDGLDFLVSRELNKIEDWILTPYYTQFEPSLSSTDDYVLPSEKSKQKLNDIDYAKSLLKFLQSIDLGKVKNPQNIGIASAYVAFMIKDYELALNELEYVNQKFKLNEIDKIRFEIVKALCLNSNQKKGEFLILDKVKSTILNKYGKQNKNFLFALGRDLEFNGNKEDAALLYYKSFEDQPKTDFFSTNFLFLSNNTFSDSSNYIYDCFSYLDSEYSASDIERVIDRIKTIQSNDEFNNWLVKTKDLDLQQLNDLCGTKHLRNNNLHRALFYFKKNDDTFWETETYKFYLNANPFYTNLYNEHSPVEADTITFNKKTLLQQLIKYVDKANNTKEEDRDYYYFLVANCYLNMSHYGNSWIMKHYQWSSSDWYSYDIKTKKKIDEEYLSCDLAKKYYLKAKSVSKSKKFSALCLRMAGRCEKYKLRRNNPGAEHDSIFALNRSYQKLKLEYPQYYDDLISNCESFEKHFQARN